MLNILNVTGASVAQAASVNAATLNSGVALSGLDALLMKIQDLVLVPIIWVLMTFAVLVFVWGVYQFFMQSDDPEARKKGWNHILWGVIGFAIILSVYGIIRLITATIGVQSPL